MDLSIASNSRNICLAKVCGPLSQASVDQDKIAGEEELRNKRYPQGLSNYSLLLQKTLNPMRHNQIQSVWLTQSLRTSHRWLLHSTGYSEISGNYNLKGTTYLVLSSTGVSRGPSSTVRKSKASKVVSAPDWYACKSEGCKKVKYLHGR